jgi:hypothetical protein
VELPASRVAAVWHAAGETHAPQQSWLRKWVDSLVAGHGRYWHVSGMTILAAITCDAVLHAA